MGLLANIEDSPAFVTGTELSAADLEVLRQNILALDGASYLAAPAFEWRWGQSLTEWALNPSPFWFGGFRYLTGQTTLYVYVNNSGLTAGDKLRISFFGDAAPDATPTSTSDTTLTAGAQTITKTISGLGFADGEVVRLHLELYNASRPATNTAWGTTRLDMITIAPVAVADAYPGVPTFGAITKANLDQLSNATDWLIRQMGLHHRPLFQSTVREKGPYGPRSSPVKAGQDNVRWNGSVRRTAEHAVVMVDATLLVLTTGYAEKIELKVDDVVRDTYNVPSTLGEYDFTLDYTIATVADGVSRIEVLYTRTGTEPAEGVTYNRLTIWRVGMDRATDPTPISIAELPARTSGTFTALQTWLNALCTHVTAIKARIDANPDVWGRQYPFRRRNGLPGFQFGYYAPNRISWSSGRIGEALIVRGQALTLARGPVILPDEPDDNGDNSRLYTVDYVLKDGATDGDTVRTQLHYLDSFAALAPGQSFAILGKECYYAAEQLLVASEVV